MSTYFIDADDFEPPAIAMRSGIQHQDDKWEGQDEKY